MRAEFKDGRIVLITNDFDEFGEPCETERIIEAAAAYRISKELQQAILQLSLDESKDRDCTRY